MQPCASNIRYYLCLSIHYTGRILAIPEVSLIGGRGRTPRADKYTEKIESAPSVDFVICCSILQSGMENLLSHPLRVLSWQPSAPIYHQSSPTATLNYLCQLVYKKGFILASGFQFGIEWPHCWGLIIERIHPGRNVRWSKTTNSLSWEQKWVRGYVPTITFKISISLNSHKAPFPTHCTNFK